LTCLDVLFFISAPAQMIWTLFLAPHATINQEDIISDLPPTHTGRDTKAMEYRWSRL
jgi:hypothetical protein